MRRPLSGGGAAFTGKGGGCGCRRGGGLPLRGNGQLQRGGRLLRERLVPPTACPPPAATAPPPLGANPPPPASAPPPVAAARASRTMTAIAWHVALFFTAPALSSTPWRVHAVAPVWRRLLRRRAAAAATVASAVGRRRQAGLLAWLRQGAPSPRRLMAPSSLRRRGWRRRSSRRPASPRRASTWPPTLIAGIFMSSLECIPLTMIATPI